MSLEVLIVERTMGFIPVLLSLSVHEWAHAWAAARLGDTTARDQGRLTLNPLAHVDPIGTLLLPLLGVPFGWAKPVPVEPTRFRSSVPMGWGLLLTALAGPVSNFALFGVSLTLFVFVPEDVRVAREFLSRAMLVNLALGLFNLLPVPPLDGSRIVDGLIPFEYRARWSRWGRILTFAFLFVLVLPVLGWGFGVFGQLQEGLADWTAERD